MILLNIFSSCFWFFKPFEGRFLHLVYTYQGYLKTKTPWIQFFDNALQPFSAADDTGIYWIIPRLAYLFSFSVENSAKLFFYGMVGICFLGGLISFFLLYSTVWQRIVVTVGLVALFLLTMRVGDVYIFYSCIPTLCIPLIQLLFNKQRSYWLMVMAGFFFGFLIFFAHAMRAYSSGAALLFILAVCISATANTNKKRLTFALFLLLGALALLSIYKYDQKKYKEFIVSEKLNTTDLEHPFWHTCYCGLGFLKFMNHDTIVFDDSCGYAKAAQLQKFYPKKSYEELLKTEVLRLLKEEKYFILLTIFSKIGVLILYLLLAMNIGLLAVWFKPKLIFIDYAYMLGIVFSSIFPLFAMPFLTYSLGFIAFGILWGIQSINKINFHKKWYD